MCKEEAYAEIVFQMTMQAARKMLDEALVSKEEYLAFEEAMQKKYSPKTGGLFSNIDLL